MFYLYLIYIYLYKNNFIIDNWVTYSINKSSIINFIFLLKFNIKIVNFNNVHFIALKCLRKFIVFIFL